MGGKSDTALGQDCNIVIKKKTKNNAASVCPCALSLAEHVDLMIARMLERLILTHSLEISKKCKENLTNM